MASTPAIGPGRTLQAETYLAGLRGRRPRLPFDPAAVEEQARRRMSAEGFAYVAGGAGVESTIRANRDALERWRIVPRMLRDVSARDLTVELFGRRLSAPVLLAPIGVLEVAHPAADLAVARAAAADGIPFVFSSQASVPMEECAAAMGDAPRWFQLYWSTVDELVESFVRRAEACGCEAIVLTLDTTMLGWRLRDLDLGHLPFLRGKGIAQYTSDPVFLELVRAAGAAPPADRPTLAALRALVDVARAYPGGLWSNLLSREPRAAVRRFVELYSRPSLRWDDLSWLRERTRLPIVLKGILHPDDAREAVGRGMDGIVVSNHGGRQVDGALGTLDALPAVVEAVGGRVPVLLDGGIRGGADVLKALALGATAVLLGRPYVYGLAVAGEDGVRQAIGNLVADFDLTLGLAGHTAASTVRADAVTRV
ncbi:MAG: lactate 2-monooxygenase [Thermoleophilia bacterium]|nr:lactate 2-monooxygenase [Thermoleophilia bacterium]